MKDPIGMQPAVYCPLTSVDALQDSAVRVILPAHLRLHLQRQLHIESTVQS